MQLGPEGLFWNFLSLTCDTQGGRHAIFEVQVTAERGQLKNTVVIKAGFSQFSDVGFRGGPGMPGESLGMFEDQGIERAQVVQRPPLAKPLAFRRAGPQFAQLPGKPGSAVLTAIQP